MRDARQRGRLQPEMNGQRQFPHRFPRMRPHNGSADNPPVPIKRNARQALRSPLRHGAVHVSVMDGSLPFRRAPDGGNFRISECHPWVHSGNGSDPANDRVGRGNTRVNTCCVSEFWVGGDIAGRPKPGKAGAQVLVGHNMTVPVDGNTGLRKSHPRGSRYPAHARKEVREFHRVTGRRRQCPSAFLRRNGCGADSGEDCDAVVLQRPHDQC